MATPLRARFSAISGGSILKYGVSFTSFLMLLVLMSSFTKPVISSQPFANNTLDKLGLTSSTPAAGAYSLRLLSSTYTNPLVRIAIGSNFYDVYPDATTDHAFSLTSPVSAPSSTFSGAPTGATGTTLSAVIGSNSATVALWFDQSGNNLTAVQANLSLQPQIINAGAIITTNNKPSIKFSGAQYLVVTTTAFNNNLSGTVVYNATSANTSAGGSNTWYNMNGIFGSEQGGDVPDFAYGVYNGGFTAGFGNGDNSVRGNTTVNNGTTRVSSWTRANTGGGVSLFNNGSTDGSATLSGNTRSSVPSVAIGAATTNGLTFFNGTISEITLFPIVYSPAERQAIEVSQGAYYSVTVLQSQISTSGTLSALTTTRGTASASTTFNVSGTALSAGILVTPPAGFEVSLNNSSFSPTLTVGTSGTLGSTPVYIRLPASANYGSYSGNVVLTSAGANTINVATLISTVLPQPGDYPTISYGTAKVVGTGSAITPITPAVTNVGAFGYGSPVNFGNNQMQVTGFKKDQQGNSYLLDLNSFNLYKYPANGSPRVEIQTGTNGNIGYPSAFTLDEAGNIYVCDAGYQTVKKIDASNGNVTTIATGVAFAYDMTITKDGIIYAADAGSGSVKKIPAGGSAAVSIGTGFNQPTGIAVDKDGNVYVADMTLSVLKKIWVTTDGHTEDFASIGQALGVAIDNANNIFTVDIQNQRLIEFPANGSGQQVLATGSNYGSVYGIYVDKGIIYLAPTGNAGKIVNPTGGYFISDILPDGLTFDQNTGIISGTPTVASAAKDYTITAYNVAGGITTTVNITVRFVNVNLSALVVSGATISPAFDPGTITYTASVGSAVASVDVTPTIAEAGETITYNGNAVTSGSTVTIPLSGGANVIPFMVTSTTGDTKTYTITINRLAPPVVSYGTAQNFTLNTAITPLTPTASNVGAPGYKAAEILASLAGSPLFMRADSHGNIYFIDDQFINVKKLDAAGNVSVYSSGYSSTGHMAIDANDNLYVVDAALNKIIKTYASDGHTQDISIEYSGLIGATKAGDIYYTAWDGVTTHLKKKYASDSHIEDLGVTFRNPVSMAVDNADNVYVLNNDNGTITKIKPDNTTSVEVNRPLESIVSVAVDGEGNIYWTDQRAVIHKKTVSSDTYEDITLPTNAFYGVIASPDGKVFYDDYTNKRIYKIVPSGGYYLDKTLPTGLVFDRATGTISGTPTELSAAKDYTITSYNNESSTASIANLAVKSGNANLNALTTYGFTLSQAFDAATITYTASVSTNTTMISLMPTIADPGSVITYKGNVVASGSLINVTLVGGANVIPIIVTAPAGNTKTYTVTINQIAPPTINYGTAQTFAVNTAITPVTPTATGVGTFGYSTALTNIGGGISQAARVKTDAEGNVYVLDNAYPFSLIEYPANNAPAIQRGTGLVWPTAFALDDAGNIYVSDAGSAIDDSSIKKIAAGSNTTTTISAGGLGFIYGIAVGKNGTLYAADYSGNAIKQVPPGGGTPVTVGTGFNGPIGVAVDTAGNVYVADQGNLKLKKIWIATDGHTEEVLNGGQYVGISIDKTGNIYLSDLQNFRIREIPADGSAVRNLASGTNYQNIYGIDVNDKGVIYIAQLSEASGKIITPSGGYFLDKALPAGLSFDQITGIISGTPTQASPATNYNITGYSAGGGTTSTINIAVASGNADLSTLAVTGATISPAFNAGTITYTSSVASSATSVSITPTVADAGATITYNGNPVTSGSAVTVPLVNGDNVIAFLVTAQSGATKTYTITISTVAPPTIGYGTAQTFAINAAITSVVPTVTNVNPFGYSNNFGIAGGNVEQAIRIKKDVQGNLYVLDNGYPGKITKFPADGSAAVEIPTGGLGAKGFAIDDAGNIYVVDVFENTLRKTEAGTGTITTLASGFNNAFSVAVGKNGIIYVADFNGSAIKQVPAGGGTPVVVGTGFNHPTDVAVDAAGNVYVADQANGKLKKIWITTDGHTEDVADIRQPVAVAVDKADNVFVSDLSNFRIYELPANGSGPQIVVSGLDVQNIYGLDADAKGAIYIAQISETSGRVFTPSGGYFINTKLPAGLLFDQNTGIISGTPTELTAAKDYIVTAYGIGGATSSTFRIGVASNNADLNTLAVTGANISPAFAAGTITYTASVTSTTASITVTPTVADAGATISYNGNPVTSGSAVTVPLAGGDNSVAFVVTAGTGTTKTYTLTINKAIPPTLSYGGAQSLVINTAISPITPTGTNVGTLGYNNPLVDFASNLGGQAVKAVFDNAGNAYVISNFKGNVQVIPADGSPSYTIGGPFNFPLALTIDKDNNLYVVDYAGATSPLYKIAAGTTTSTLLTSAYQYILGITADNLGNLYIGDINGHKVSKYNISAGTAVDVSSAFNYPCTVVLRGDKLFVQDLQTTQIFRMDLDGNNITQVVNYSGSSSFDIDATGYIYSGGAGVIRWNLDGSNAQTVVPDISDLYTTSLDTKGNIYIGKVNGETMKLARPSGGYFIDKLLPAGLSFDANTGTISGTPTKLSPPTQYRITAYNGPDSTSSRITLGVDANKNLTNLLADVGTLTPTFDADSTNYKVTVDNGTTSANITAILSELSNSLTINGVTATSGTFASVALNVGDNTIPVVVTTPLDGSIKTYTVKIHRISNDYKLHNLTVSAGSLTPSFNADVSDYTVDLPYGTSSAKLTPTAYPLAAIKVADVPVLNGAESQPLSLNTGDNNIEVRVTAEDGTSATIYTVNLRVAGPSSVSLSDLTLSAGTLNPAFSAGNTNYQVSVPVGTSTITVHPVVEDALSVATVNGSALDGTSGSVNVPLNDGINVIAVSVLANDGTTTNSYTITVNKLIPTPTTAPIAAQVYNTGIAITPLGTGFGNVAASGYFALADTISRAIPTPTGIAINTDGDLFIADVTAGAIYKIPAAGGAPVAVLSGLNTPLGVATDAAGNVYAAGILSNSIKKATPGGTITNLGSALSFPTALTVDAAGDVFVVETTNHTVKKITAAGVTTTVTTALVYPYGITADANNIYVTDNDQGTIVRFNKSGGARTDLISGLINPTDVKLDAEGNIYVNQGGSNTLTKFDKNGANPVDISTGYTGLFGLAIGKAGSIYTTDNGNQRVNKLTPSGGYYLNDPLPDGLVFNATTGIISGTPTTASTAKDYTITAYNSGGGTASVVNISVLANTNLANLAVSTGTLDPEFESATTSYAVSVPYIVSSLVFTPTVADANATVTVNGIATASGTVSAAVPLGEDVTNIPVIVTGRDNVATKQYTIAVTRRPALVQVSFILDPLSVLVKTTGTSNYNYTTGVSPAISSIRVKPTTRDADAVITINGQVVGSGTFSNPITLNIDPTIVEVVVKKADVIVSTYTITVNHNASNNALAGLALDPPSLFVRTTGTADVNYTTSVAPGVTSVKLKPNAQQGDAVIRINGDLVTTGTFSNPITLNAGPTVINVSVTAQDGITVNTYAVTVNHDGSNNSKVSLALNPSSVLITTAGTSTYNYSTSVSSDVNSISVKPTAQQENSVVRINGDIVASGTYSNPISLNIGATVINVSATAQDGVTVSTYSITVNRAGSNNAKVSLALNPSSVLETITGTSTYNYATSVSPEVNSISVKPTAQQADAVIKVNGNIVNSGTYSDPIALNMGATVINVSVTAQDGVTVNTFSVTVNRTGSNNAKVGLALNPASVLITTTGASTYNYVTSVSATVTSVSVRPTAQQADAVIRVNGDIVASGALSAPIVLGAGSTVINVSGTAQDGVTVNTYSITVNRTGSNNAKVSLALNPASELATTTGTSTYNYVTSVSSGVSSISIKPTAQQADAVIKVNGNIVNSGTYSAPIALNISSTLIIVSVTAQDGVTVNTFSITVNRTGSSNVLARIALNPVTALTSTTGPGDINYLANVGEGQSTIRVIPTVYDNATVTVNGIAVTGGTASDPVALTPGGSTLITIVVTAENGSTTKTYTVNVNRPSSSLMVDKNDSQLLLAGKPANNVAPTGDDGVVVHQGVSPNGDGSNDFLYIEGISAYPGNKLSIMNTSGALVFEARDYGKDGNNIFNGHSNKTGALLKPGTYFYSLEYQVNKKAKRKTGYIVIKY